MRVGLLFIMLSLLSACTTRNETLRAQHIYATPGSTSASAWSTEVFVTPQCILTEPVGDAGALGTALIGALAPALVDTSLAYFGEALKSAAADHTTTYSGQRITPLFKIAPPPGNSSGSSAIGPNPEFGCVLVVAGRFTERKPALLTRPSTARSLNNIDAVTAVLIEAGLKLHGAPDFIYEGAIAQFNARDAFYVRSRYLYVGQYQRRKAQALALTLSIDNPLGEGAGTTLRAAALNFGDVTQGAILIGDQIGEGARSRLMLPIAPPQVVKDQLAIVNAIEGELADTNKALQTARAALAATRPPGAATRKKLRDDIRRLEPMEAALEARKKEASERFNATGHVEVVATIVETQSGSATAAFLSSVFEKAKPGISTALTDELNPQRREAIADEEQAAREKLEDELSANQITYLEAKGAFDDEKDPRKKLIAQERLLVALRKLNRTRASMGLPPIVE